MSAGQPTEHPSSPRSGDPSPGPASHLTPQMEATGKVQLEGTSWRKKVDLRRGLGDRETGLGMGERFQRRGAEW